MSVVGCAKPGTTLSFGPALADGIEDQLGRRRCQRWPGSPSTLALTGAAADPACETLGCIAGAPSEDAQVTNMTRRAYAIFLQTRKHSEAAKAQVS
jgi:hypothetical protein